MYCLIFLLHSIMAIKANDLSENGNLLGKNRLIGIIFRLKADMIRFPVEPFHRCIFITDQSHYNFSISCGFLLSHNQKIAFHNPRIDHAVSANRQHETVFITADQFCRHRQYSFHPFIRNDGITGTNCADNGSRQYFLCFHDISSVSSMARELAGFRLIIPSFSSLPR